MQCLWEEHLSRTYLLQNKQGSVSNRGKRICLMGLLESGDKRLPSASLPAECQDSEWKALLAHKQMLQCSSEWIGRKSETIQDRCKDLFPKVPVCCCYCRLHHFPPIFILLLLGMNAGKGGMPYRAPWVCTPAGQGRRCYLYTRWTNHRTPVTHLCVSLCNSGLMQHSFYKGSPSEQMFSGLQIKWENANLLSPCGGYG